jgi:hypothetical protein
LQFVHGEKSLLFDEKIIVKYKYITKLRLNQPSKHFICNKLHYICILEFTNHKKYDIINRNIVFGTGQKNKGRKGHDRAAESACFADKKRIV